MTTPDLSDLISESIREAQSYIKTVRLAEVYVANPDGTVMVQPVTSRIHKGRDHIDGAGTFSLVPHPNGRDTIEHWPPTSARVAWPSGGGFVQTWPLQPRDIVLLVTLMLNESTYLNTGVVRSAPPSETLHDGINFAIPFSLRPRTNPQLPTAVSLTEHILGREDGSVQIRIGPTEIKLGGAEAVSPVAKGDVADANWAAMKAWAATLKSALLALGITLPELGVAPYPINSEQAVKAKVV